MGDEILQKAREAKSVDELLELSKAEGIEMTEEQAKICFERLHGRSGELSDEELQAVSGGFGYVSGDENVQPGGIPQGTHVWSTEWAERGLTKCGGGGGNCQSAYYVVRAACAGYAETVCPKCGLTRLFRESELKEV